MNITLHYYAMLREKAETSLEAVETNAGTVRALFSELDTRHAFNVDPERIRVAINNTISTWDGPLKDGDEVTFIPPTAGG